MENELKDSKGYRYQLVLLPFFSHSLSLDDNQLYVKVKVPFINGHFYCPHRIFKANLHKDPKARFESLKSDKRCFWLGSDLQYVDLNEKRISLNAEIPFSLPYTDENCQKLNQLNCVFMNGGSADSMPQTRYNPNLLEEIEQAFKKEFESEY